MVSIVIILVSIVMCSFIMFVIFQMDDKMRYLKNIKSGPLPVTVKKVAPVYSSIKEVLDAYLKNAPDGCMWNVEKATRGFRENGKIKQYAAAKITLITPLGKGDQFVLILEKGDDRLKKFEDQLKNNIAIALKNYSKAVDGINAHKDIEQNWDGVYMKDV